MPLPDIPGILATKKGKSFYSIAVSDRCGRFVLLAIDLFFVTVLP